ncbi:MAG TPA: VanW family protein [Virgibacillus sp.]|nr:VanW family protein [Virgibacillus sp.]
MHLLQLFLLFIVPVDTDIERLHFVDNGKTIQTIEREQMSLDDIFIDEKKLIGIIHKLNELIYTPPQHATINDEDQIIKEKPGRQLNVLKTKQLLHQFFYEGNITHISIPTEQVFPRVDSELLSQINARKLGVYTTDFTESNKERAHNIRLSADAINNHVVFPGEKFSFNEVVGERTKARGYKRAPVIVKGELTEDVGGGICQVSSTLFNAVHLKGIQIVERYKHSRSVPYVPPGKDAAVSWWGPDFVFKNKYNQPILIRTITDQGQITISIYSAEDATPSK